MSKFLEKIIGSKEKYFLQHRILNASMLLTAILSMVASISNFIIGLSWTATFIAILGMLLFLFLYFLSFYKYQYKLVSILGLGLLPTLLLPLVWFSNEGSNGSSPYLSFLILTGILTIAKGKTKKILVVILTITTVSLLVFEYLYPETLIPYPGRAERFADLILAFIITIICITAYINIYYNEYLTANKKLNEKNTLLEKSKEEITIQQSKIEAQKSKLEEKANDLQEANKTKDRFFSIIAHDLKNPFHTFLGFTDLIEDAVENNNLEQVKHLNKLMQQNSAQTYKLLLNLLEWSKAQTNQILYKPEKIKLHETIMENVKLFEYQANKKGVKLSAELSSGIAFADMNMVNTILRNLISNAIKYTQNGEVKIKCSSEVSDYKISISDTGVGILEENLKYLFDIGENKSTPGTDGEKGTGLGLILCKEFIEKHNGEIFVESTVNKGSVFSFSLPLFKT